MSIHQELRRAHAIRRQTWGALAVPDDGIDLKRIPRHVSVRPAPGSCDTLTFSPAIPARAVPIQQFDPVWVEVQILRIKKLRKPVTPANPVTCTRATIAKVAAWYGTSRAKIVGKSHKRDAVDPRHFAVYIAHNITRKTFTWLGYQFGDRDHTTMEYAIRKTARRVVRDFELGSELAALECVIRGNHQ